MAEGEAGLVADVGRVSVRFGLAAPGDPMPRDVRRFAAEEHSTFTSALVAYLAQAGLSNVPLRSALAVAGTARGDMINLTGSRWYISLAGVEAVLRVRPRALNECAASALALTTLGSADFLPLPGPPVGPPRPGGSYLVVSPGTGLGVAALVSDGDRMVPVQSEAGHMALSIATDDEAHFAQKHRRDGYIGAEALVSARGFVDAYHYFTTAPRSLQPEDVTRNAAHDPAAAAAVRMVVGQLGAMIGNLVLAFGAWDGVYVTGAIARALRPRLGDPVLRERMLAPRAFRRLLGEVPIAVVGRSDLELVGAAAALRQDCLSPPVR